MLLVLAIGDFARWYSTAITIEAAAREAADYGAFDSSNWVGDEFDPTSNHAKTLAAMRARACTAASTLSGYVGDPVGTAGMTCTNPAVATVLDPPGATDCSDNTREPPCQVIVTVTYQFNLITAFPPLPGSFSFSRESSFAVSKFPSS